MIQAHAVDKVLHFLRKAVVPKFFIHGEGPAGRGGSFFHGIAVADEPRVEERIALRAGVLLTFPFGRRARLWEGALEAAAAQSPLPTSFRHSPEIGKVTEAGDLAPPGGGGRPLPTKGRGANRVRFTL